MTEHDPTLYQSPQWLDELRSRQQDPEFRSAMDARSKQWEQEQASDRAESIVRALSDAGVPTAVQNYARSPRPTEALSLVSVWTQSEARWLVLSGPTGIGKSVAAAHAVVLAGHGRWLDVWTACRASDGKRDRNDRTLWERCETTRLLIVDDLGTEDAETRDRMTRTLVARDNAGMRTIVTTNLAPPDLARMYDRRLIDRIATSIHAIAQGSLRHGDWP